MERITKPKLINFFMWFCADLGKKISLSDGDLRAVKKWRGDSCRLPCEIVPYRTVGAWSLDYAGCYGGWQIQEMDNEQGGISCPMGHARYKTGELVALIHFARNALRLRLVAPLNCHS